MLDPYAVLGVGRDADAPTIHTAYRKAVRRTHPDVGGSAAEFESVQHAYETLRDPVRRSAHDATSRPRAPRRPRPPDAGETGSATGEMDRLLADSRRLENEARRLAGLPPRDFGDSPEAPPAEDSLGAILGDAQVQLRDTAVALAREVRRRARRML